jgi:hypothetical protein
MTKPKMRLKITLDTNILPLARIDLGAVARISDDSKITTVTAREVGSQRDPELSLLAVPETWVMGESPLGVGVLGSTVDSDLFEKTLTIISNGACPKRGGRESLTPTQNRQKRDAMIFCAHVREKRDIFVTDDVKAFGAENTAQRQRIEALAPTRVMTLAEFERFCRER